MAGYFRLQELVTAGTEMQEREYAVDVGPYRTLTVQIRVVTAAGASGNLFLDHAAVNDESFFQPITIPAGGLPVALTATGTTILVIEAPLRFIRWRTENVSGSPEFMIDVVARET